MTRNLNLTDKSEKELEKLLLEKRDALRHFRFQIASGKTKNVKEGRGLRKEIARLLTEINNLKKAANL